MPRSLVIGNGLGGTKAPGPLSCFDGGPSPGAHFALCSALSALLSRLESSLSSRRPWNSSWARCHSSGSANFADAIRALLAFVGNLGRYSAPSPPRVGLAWPEGSVSRWLLWGLEDQMSDSRPAAQRAYLLTMASTYYDQETKVRPSLEETLAVSFFIPSFSAGQASQTNVNCSELLTVRLHDYHII